VTVRPKPDPDPSDKIESDEWTMPEPELRFRVSGTFAEDGSITVTNVGQEMARGVHPGYPTDAELVLLDQSGRKLARGELTGHIGHMVLGPRRDAPLGGALDCRPFHSSGFSGSVRAVDGGVVLQIERGGEAIWTRRAPGPIPRIDSVRCEIDGNVGRISWSDDASKTDSYDAQPQFRRDSGGDWLAFQTRRPPAPPIGERDLVAGPVEFDIQDLPSGEGFLRMSVSDGFYCVFSEPIRVTVPPHPICFLQFSVGAGITPEGWGLVTLSALATQWRGSGLGRHGPMIPDEAYRWLIDGELCDIGSTIHIDPPSLGLHEVTVVVTVGDVEHRKAIPFEVTTDLLARLEKARAEIPNLRRSLPLVDWAYLDAERDAARRRRNR
jgi:hypothetical protein